MILCIGKAGLVMTTDKLMGMLEASPENFRDIAFTTDMQISFGEYLAELMREKSFDSSRLIKEACLSRTYAYQFISGQRIPGRDIIIRIGLAMQLDVETVQRMLAIAQKGTLYPKKQRDSVILYCIRRKMKLDETNIILQDVDEEPLL